jgi:hypothetical protein
MAAAAAPPAPSAHALIKLAADAAPAEGEVFAELALAPGDTVARLAERACAKFGWGVPTRARLFLVPREPGADEPPSPSDEARAAELTRTHWTLERAGVASGAWLLARVLAPAAAAPPALPPPPPPAPAQPAREAPAVSVSEIVGPLFEDEARAALRHFVNRVCPWAASVSDITARSALELSGDEGGAVESRQVDIFAYVAEADVGGECVDERESGAFVVRPDDGLPAQPALRAAAIPAGTCFSPADRSVVGPHKYLVAEAYSGKNGRTIVDKAAQLDSAVEFIVRRFADRSGVAVRDVTEVVGAAMLFFPSPSGEKRRDVLAARVASVRESLGRHRHLRRLARAGRLVVVVLDVSQAPHSHAQRSVALALAGRLRILAE